MSDDELAMVKTRASRSHPHPGTTRSCRRAGVCRKARLERLAGAVRGVAQDRQGHETDIRRSPRDVLRSNRTVGIIETTANAVEKGGRNAAIRRCGRRPCPLDRRLFEPRRLGAPTSRRPGRAAASPRSATRAGAARTCHSHDSEISQEALGSSSAQPTLLDFPRLVVSSKNTTSSCGFGIAVRGGSSRRCPEKSVW